MTNKELIAKCKEYQQITEEIKAKELQQKAIQAELKRNWSERKLTKWTLMFFILATR